ncbi:MAG: hypothetical protein NZ534_00015 [Bacteroidia bacterium]|nr:hypothetical protein [Bacteroidia bacterium]
MGVLAQLSGIPQLQQLGPRLMATAEAQRAAAQQVRDRALQRSLAHRQQLLAAQDRAADRALRASIAGGQMQLRRELERMRQEGRAAKAAGPDRQAIERSTTRLGEFMTKNSLIEIGKALEQAESVLRRFPEGEIPGIGGAFNIRNLGIGTALTHVEPSVTSKKEIGGLRKGEKDVGDVARKVQMKIAPLQNIVTRVRAGAAQTVPEMANLLREFGTTAWNTDADFRRGLRQLISTYRTVLGSALASYPREAAREFVRRLPKRRIPGMSPEDNELYAQLLDEIEAESQPQPTDAPSAADTAEEILQRLEAALSGDEPW